MIIHIFHKLGSLRTTKIAALCTGGLLLSIQVGLSHTSIGKSFDSAGHTSSNLIADAVKLLDVGTFNAMDARRVTGDGLTPDHIPSGAAVVKAYELKNNTTVKRDSDLYKKIYGNANTIVYSGAIHLKSSRTYGGRNTEAQILQDAKDLKGAFTRDTEIIRKPLIDSGLSSAAVTAAFKKLDDLNKASGLY